MDIDTYCIGCLFSGEDFIPQVGEEVDEESYESMQSIIRGCKAILKKVISGHRFKIVEHEWLLKEKD